MIPRDPLHVHCSDESNLANFKLILTGTDTMQEELINS